MFTVFLSGSSYASTSVIMGLQPSAPSIQPIPGDYDGDFKADPAVYDPIAKHLLVRFSSQAYSLNTMPIGNSSCGPVSGDFDGDCKADPAVYSAATGQTTVWPSGANYTASVVSLGGASWLDASKDYDGDGKTDPAVYAPGLNAYYAWMSDSGYMSQGSCMVSQITRPTLTDFHTWAKTNHGKGANAGNEALVGVKALFNWAKREEVCDHSLKAFPPITRLPPETRTFTDEDLKKLLAILPNDFRDIVEFGFLTGLRPIELRGLK